NASKHTGGNTDFELRTTNYVYDEQLDRYQIDDYQNIDHQFFPSFGEPVSKSLEIGSGFVENIYEVPGELKVRYKNIIGDVRDARRDGINIAMALPTHTKVHDLDFPLGLYRAAEEMTFPGEEDPEQWMALFAK